MVETCFTSIATAWATVSAKGRGFGVSDDELVIGLEALRSEDMRMAQCMKS